MNNPIRSLKQRGAVYTAVGALALGGLFSGLLGADSTKPAVAVKRDAQAISPGQLEPSSFSKVVKQVAPSVVTITTETKARRVTSNGRETQGLDNPLFREFFGGRVPEMRQSPQAGLGSGVVISADGYIVTNNHVVENADRLTVTFKDGREFSAKVVGRDSQTDVAVIKIDAKDLPSITFADSSKVEVGDRVLAVGNPFGIGATVTSGIVSATSRKAGIGLEYEDFIQTDAAINPGNSGGALVDVQGRLIGVNTAILSRSGGFQGVGLAVPANLVNHVADSLVKNGKVVRGFIGVRIQDITPALADSFGMKDRSGALIADVEPDSPAEKAGLKGGDVITSVNGEPVSDASRLSFAVSAVAPGSKLKVAFLRDGKAESLNVVAGTRSPSRMAQSSERGESTKDEGVLNGVAVDDLNTSTRQELAFPARLKGALVTEVEPNSAAARAGISTGDVILEINKQRVNSAGEAVDLSASAENKKTLVKLWSKGKTVFVVVDESGAEKSNS